jgi:predicted transcriptional regulator/DNA-binding Xre family transcriptional regulator
MGRDAFGLDEDEGMPDSLTIGRRIRQLRTQKGLTLEHLATAIDRAPSQLSVIENGKRELKLSEIQNLSRALGVTVDDLLTHVAPTHRAALEIALERAQRGPLYAALGLPPLPIRKTLSNDAIETILKLHDELQRLHSQRAATPEEARRANTELRRAMRARNNYFPELEATAKQLLDAVGHSGGPLSQRVASDIASHLGFTLHYVPDLPMSTRSVTDLQNGRIYLPVAEPGGADQRSTLLQALASQVLGLGDPTDYADFLRQRVETNYLAGALMVPERTAVEFLQAAKDKRELSVEDLRDAFAVTYETAAHRFTNLATQHLGIPVHFLKVHESGTISKAYENDSVLFPSDALGAVEGQNVCRYWSARKVFELADRFSPYHQYTDKPTGTYWCTSRIQTTSRDSFSVSVGTPFAHVKWFRGRDTTSRSTSTCPDENCCRRAPAGLALRWEGRSIPSARLNSSLLAAMPIGVFPGVDSTEVYRFLERHAPAGVASSSLR